MGRMKVNQIQNEWKINFNDKKANRNQRIEVSVRNGTENSFYG